LLLTGDLRRLRALRARFDSIRPQQNIGAIEWKSRSERLVLIAGAPLTALAATWGVWAYLVEVETGVIVARYNQADLTLFRKRLGTRFR
jgi:hypothetical protein